MNDIPRPRIPSKLKILSENSNVYLSSSDTVEVNSDTTSFIGLIINILGFTNKTQFTSEVHLFLSSSLILQMMDPVDQSLCSAKFLHGNCAKN